MIRSYDYFEAEAQKLPGENVSDAQERLAVLDAPQETLTTPLQQAMQAEEEARQKLAEAEAKKHALLSQQQQIDGMIGRWQKMDEELRKAIQMSEWISQIHNEAKANRQNLWNSMEIYNPSQIIDYYRQVEAQRMALEDFPKWKAVKEQQIASYKSKLDELCQENGTTVERIMGWEKPPVAPEPVQAPSIEEKDGYTITDRRGEPDPEPEPVPVKHPRVKVKAKNPDEGDAFAEYNASIDAERKQLMAQIAKGDN